MAIIIGFLRHLWLRLVLWRYFMGRAEDWDAIRNLEEIATVGRLLSPIAFTRYRHRIGETIEFSCGFTSAAQLLNWFDAASAAVTNHEYLDGRVEITGPLMGRHETNLADFLVNDVGGIIPPPEFIIHFCDGLSRLEKAIVSVDDLSWQRMYRRKLASGFWLDLCTIMDALTNAALTYE